MVRILIVDYNEHIRRLLRCSLAEAIVKIGSASYKALVTDLNLAGHAEGFQVLAEMRRAQPDCRCFIITRYADLEARITNVQPLVDAHFFKPIDIPDFLNILEKKIA